MIVYFVVNNYNYKNILFEYINNLKSYFDEKDIEVKFLEFNVNKTNENIIYFNNYNDFYTFLDSLNGQLIICFYKQIYDNIMKTKNADAYLKNKMFYLNTEPYISKNVAKITRLLNIGINIIEYYYGNKQLINNRTDFKYTNQLLFVPQLYSDCDYINIINPEKTIDCGFIFKCRQNDRRGKIVDELKKDIQNICVINAYGNKRDELVSRCKILVNVRSHDIINDNRESMRIDRLIAKKIIVISEDINVKYQYADKFIIYTKYNKITKRVKEILADYNKYYHKIYDKFDLDELRKENKRYFDELLGY